MSSRVGSRSQREVQSQSGFTIIETLIVLAVAGMILLMVFQVIPTIQRSGRNNERKQDIAAILDAVSSYQLSNSGNFPPQPSASSDFLQYSRLTLYIANKLDPAENQIIVHAPPSPGAAVPHSASGNVSRVDLYNYQKCDSENVGASTNVGAGYGDIVALYALETGGGNAAGQCREL